ncbi:MAG: TlpA disulfide reductase family protein [Ilumatobacter sp.]|uniref:TlpA family protein disulfide reductase n=1 Tax=Ilumatobacter sp. TaxID=1967498 RepID=UPI002636FF8E|nr:TlpA disulfide reductase family protein [Ilumatobacter sp.]MDJ0769059.1 TlpA disulfide reductase family protein [Ilumatobacter sp.]
MTARRRRRSLLFAASALVLAACGSSDGGGDPSADGDGGERLPDVAIEELATGEPGSLADIEGPAVVNLWATWCAPCRAEIPDFESVHRARGDEVRFVGINIGEGSDRALDFLDEVGASYDQFLDPEGFVVTELRTTTMPVTIVLDADGAISKRHLGPLDQGGLNDAIDEALAVS